CSAGDTARKRRPSVDLFDLVEFELHRRFPAKHGHDDPQAAALQVDFLDHARETAERTGHDPHLAALLEGYPRFRIIDAHLLQNALDLRLVQRHGLVAGADKTGDAGRIAHDVPGIVANHHL